jgi:holo-[acyl-carrier protein] synthase
MSVAGTGVDLIEIARIRRSLHKFGDRFLGRCFCPAEIAYCQSRPDPARHFAARFAAKEAIAKAFGTGIGRQLGWTDLEIGRHPHGAPYVILHHKAIALADARGITRIQISLTHTDTHAAATAVALTGP